MRLGLASHRSNLRECTPYKGRRKEILGRWRPKTRAKRGRDLLDISFLRRPATLRVHGTDMLFEPPGMPACTAAEYCEVREAGKSNR